MRREATQKRQTRETDIEIKFSLDGGEILVETGIGFFDHILTSFALHGRFGLTVRARGDLHVDGHHTVEDVGLVLGQAFRAAVGSVGFERFGEAKVPMDEALSEAVVDLSGRAYLVYHAALPQAQVGTFDSCLGYDFWRAFTQMAGVTMHLSVKGENAHHMFEAMFKAAGRALYRATRVVDDKIPSTKGVL